MTVAYLRAQIEAKYPSAFTVYSRPDRKTIPTGVPQIDDTVQGIPLHAVTEICGSSLASSGKTSVLMSLLARASQKHFCALVDASDTFDPASGHAAGINLSRMLWVRCGINKTRLRPMEQAFKVADILLQSTGFGLIAVDLGNIPEHIVGRVPLASWFRFSRVIEKQPAALVFLEQEPHAASYAGLVLKVQAAPDGLRGKLFTGLNFKVNVLRDHIKKPVHSSGSQLLSETRWA